MRNHWISLVTLLAFVLAGCGASQINGQNENPTQSSQETLLVPAIEPQFTKTKHPAPSPSSTPTTPNDQVPEVENATFASRKIIEKTKTDLVEKIGINANQIRVTEARAVIWQDASLGCPQSDMAYAQIITPGYWILLEADGKQYPYHTDQNGQFILCLGNSSDPGSELPVIPVVPGEIDDGQPWMPVD